MASIQQITANQMNAQHSTGPRTDNGKDRSSRNALRHGLASPGAILPHESRHEFRRLIEEYTAEFHPATEHERYMVWQMADARFRVARLNRFEQCLWDINDDKRPCHTEDHRIVRDMMQRGDIFDRLHRYRNSADRTYHKAIKQLLESQTRRAADLGSFCKTAPAPLKVPANALQTSATVQTRTSAASAPQAKRAEPSAASVASCSSSSGSFCKTTDQIGTEDPECSQNQA